MAAPRNDNVKEKILDAATGLLDTQTFADISLAEIAAAAGVSKGTLYYYYKNKTDILFDLTNRYLDRQWDELIAWTENKDKDTSVHRLVKYVVERNTASAGAHRQRVCRCGAGRGAAAHKGAAGYGRFAGRSGTACRLRRTGGAAVCSAARRRTDAGCLPPAFLCGSGCALGTLSGLSESFIKFHKLEILFALLL